MKGDRIIFFFAMDGEQMFTQLV